MKRIYSTSQLMEAISWLIWRRITIVPSLFRWMSWTRLIISGSSFFCDDELANPLCSFENTSNTHQHRCLIIFEHSPQLWPEQLLFGPFFLTKSTSSGNVYGLLYQDVFDLRFCNTVCTFNLFWCSSKFWACTTRVHPWHLQDLNSISFFKND